MIRVTASYTHPPIGNQSWKTRRIKYAMNYCSRCLVYASSIYTPQETGSYILLAECWNSIGGVRTEFSMEFKDETPMAFIHRLESFLMSNPNFTVSVLTPPQREVECSHA